MYEREKEFEIRDAQAERERELYRQRVSEDLSKETPSKAPLTHPLMCRSAAVLQVIVPVVFVGVGAIVLSSFKSFIFFVSFQRQLSFVGIQYQGSTYFVSTSLFIAHCWFCFGFSGSRCGSCTLSGIPPSIRLKA